MGFNSGFKGLKVNDIGAVNQGKNASWDDVCNASCLWTDISLSIVTLDSAPYFTATSRPNLRRKGKPCLTHTLRIILLGELRSFAVSLFN